MFPLYPRHRATWGIVLLIDSTGSRFAWIPRRNRFGVSA